ncbi:MAG: Uncharacterized protein XD54_2081, partial [Thermococcus sibiricus]
MIIHGELLVVVKLLEKALEVFYFGRSVVLGPGPGFEPGLGDPQSPVLTRL